ncbi:Otogelin [Merluccius polli]|uniref:Otogelin n=1 Tax=Merluccius polli TaxID=89951 RepID=A0AA47NY91_MERPO|nr:Otogelin [Merluccius polli]
MVAPHTTIKVTSETPSTRVGTTAETTTSPRSTLSSIGPAISRTPSAPLSITALFWLTSSAKPTLLQEGKFISTTTRVPTSSTVKEPTITSTLSTSPAYSTPETTQSTTHPAVVTTTVPGLRPTTVSDTVVSERTTTDSTSTTTAYLESTKEPRTTEVASSPTTTTITPGSPSTVSRMTSPLHSISSTETKTTSAPVITVAKTTESVTPVAPFTTRKTTTLHTSAEVTIAFISTATTEKTQSTTQSELPESTSTHMAPTTTTLASPRSPTSTGRATTEQVTTLVSTASRGPASTTTTAVAPPFRTTEPTVVPPVTSKHSTESTSWSAGVPATRKTTTTASLHFPDAFTASMGPLVTTKPSVSPVTLTKTTSVYMPTITESSTLKTSTTRTSEPWRPSHWETSSTATYGTEKVTTPRVTPTVSATSTTRFPHAAITTKIVASMATSAAATGTTTATTTPTTMAPPEIAQTKDTKATTEPVATKLSAVPLTPKTSRTTSSTKTTQSVMTTTLRPITPHLVTEATPPMTGKVEISTTATTTQPPSPWSPQYPTTSTALPRPTTHQEKVTTRVVSTARATPATTMTKITTATNMTTTPRVLSPTRVPPEVTTTERTTMRFTTATRSSTVTSSLIAPGIPTATPITGTTVVSVVPSTSTRTTSEPATTESGIEHVFLTTPVAITTSTTPSGPAPVPSTTIVKTPTDVPMGVTREPAVTSEKTSTTKETEVAPSAGTTVAPAPAEAASIWSPGTRPSSTPAPTGTSRRPTEPSEPSESTTLVSTASPVPIAEWSTLEASKHTVDVTSSIVISSTRMCTPPYSEFIDECTKYICVNSQLVLFNKTENCPYNSSPPNCGLLGFAILVNGDKCCPKWDCPCRCSVFPDLNIITFDGNSVPVYKAASYIVTQLPNETVSVLVQECPADSAELLWNFTNLCLVALNITHKSNHIVINRLQRRLYVNSRYAKPRFRKFGFEILDTGNMYLIRSPSGLKLQWFHSTGMMVIETENSSNKLPTMGLCGYCDGDPANDLTLANGTVVGESEDPALFIDSWQVPNTTSYISHSRRREVNCSTSDCSHCMAMLQDNSFLPCHDFVPPSTFCEMWVRDAEYVNNRCVALAAYAASCHKFNVCIEWRSPEYCPFICPGTLHYQACLPACTAQSCPNQDFEMDPGQCSGLTEGCVCPEGTLLHRPYSALCIPPDKCACTDSAGVPRANGELWKASKDGCCMYRCDNDAIKPVEYNCSAVALPTCHRAGEVVISLADDNNCCPQKGCVCNQSLCDVVPPLCHYGEKLVSYYREDSCCPHYVCGECPNHPLVCI